MGYAKVIAGIYKITNTVNNKVYIGQSVNVSKRLTEHKYHLKKNTHYNRALQNSYKCHGIQSFVYELIEECNLDNIDERECYWIEFYDSTNRSKGYNFETGGNANKTVSQETRDKIRNTLKGTRLGEENPMFGVKVSDESKNKMKISSQGTNSILNEAQVREIKIALHIGILQSDLVDIFNVDVTTINKIAKAKNWSWVLPEFNDTQSEHVKQYRDKMKIVVFELFEKGLSAPKIAEQTPYSISEISKCLSGKHTETYKERHNNIIRDYKNGMTKDEISEKYNMNTNHIGKIIKEITELEYANRIIKVKEMYEQGLTNGQIAKELNIHRTTVTDILKGRTKEVKRKRTNFTDELKKQILDLIDQGFSQRKVSETLDISRANVRKAIELSLS